MDERHQDEKQLKEEKLGDIIVLWDWENTAKGMRERGYAKGNYDLSAGFDRLKQWLEGTGKVINVFLFSPMHKTYGFDKSFHLQDFTIVLCPKILRISETGEVAYIDTTDESLIKHGRLFVDYIPNIRYLCLGSGDKHFAPFLRTAKDKGIKVMVVYGNEMSLSKEILDLADDNPITGEKMIHLFSPTKDPASNNG